MATVEEQLVGFQVVRELNRVQKLTLTAAGALKVSKDDEEAKRLKGEVGVAIAGNEAKIGTLKTFLAAYKGGQSALAKGYQAIGVTPKQVSDELENLETVQAATKQGLQAAKDEKDAIVSVGNQMHSGVAGHVTEIADEELHYQPIQMQVSCWDLVNVMALVLQGIHPGTGAKLKYTTVDKRKWAVARHMKTFDRAKKYLDDSKESESFTKAVQQMKDSLASCKTLDELATLGEAVDALVPRAPLLRRSWQNNG